jgi:hypothetical protein
MPSLSRSIWSYLISQFKDFPIVFYLWLFKILFIYIYSLIFSMFIWYLSTFIVYISYRRAAMNDSGSGYQGATGMLDAEAEGWALRCNASNMSNVCTFFPLNLWFRHELKIPLGWGKKHRFLRTVLTFTNWIGFTISFEAFEWHSYITVIFCFQKKYTYMYICIYIYI